MNVEADKPLSAQLVLVDLPEGSPYENLHAIVTNAVSPFFKSFIRSTGKADRDGDKIAPSVEKKLAEVEMGLLHLQQNIDIPEITLVIHPNVYQIIKKAADEGRRAKVADFGDKVEDANFLNQLQSGVNRWIREIQKVSVLKFSNHLHKISLLGYKIRQRSCFWDSFTRNKFLAEFGEGTFKNSREEGESRHCTDIRYFETRKAFSRNGVL